MRLRRHILTSSKGLLDPPSQSAGAMSYGVAAGVAAGDGAGEPKLGKFTVGALSAPCCDAKNGFEENPSIPAIAFVGNRRTAVLKFWTAVLKLFRSTAMRFSVPSSCACNS